MIRQFMKKILYRVIAITSGGPWTNRNDIIFERFKHQFWNTVFFPLKIKHARIIHPHQLYYQEVYLWNDRFDSQKFVHSWKAL